jgi:hypothetical protein
MRRRRRRRREFGRDGNWPPAFWEDWMEGQKAKAILLAIGNGGQTKDHRP